MTDNSAQMVWVNETGKLKKCPDAGFLSENVDNFDQISVLCKETLFLDRKGAEYCMNCTTQSEALLVSLQFMEKPLLVV